MIDKKEIVGAEFVRSYGGVVDIIPYIEGKSTTALIEKIQKPLIDKIELLEKEIEELKNEIKFLKEPKQVDPNRVIIKETIGTKR
jgi:hypothetical protein